MNDVSKHIKTKTQFEKAENNSFFIFKK